MGHSHLSLLSIDRTRFLSFDRFNPPRIKRSSLPWGARHQARLTPMVMRVAFCRSEERKRLLSMKRRRRVLPIERKESDLLIEGKENVIISITFSTWLKNQIYIYIYILYIYIYIFIYVFIYLFIHSLLY